LSAASDLQRFYELLEGVAKQPRQASLLSELTGRPAWPNRGVYFFREPGEERLAYPSALRIVRVGTHAVSAGSKSKLWGRLRTHRGDRAGGGNHRGSVFRLHVGAALLAQTQTQHPTWGVGSSAPKEIRVQEADIERQVSAYLGTMSVLWIDVPDEPSKSSTRAYIERNSIALLSMQLTPIDRPSDGWLGLASPHEAIRRSGLWNVNYVTERYDPEFLDVLDTFVAKV